MGLFDFWRRTPDRRYGDVPNGSVPISASNFLDLISMGTPATASGITVTVDNALGVPAISAAVNFLSGTLAGFPVHVYRRGADGERERVNTPLARMLNGAVNDETTSFQWRKSTFDQVFTTGRGLTFIERSPAGQVINLWPLDPTKATITRKDRRTVYTYRDGDRTLTYDASEIIDIPFMLKPDGIGHRGPIMTCRDAVALAIAATQFGAKYFQNGGVPPFAITGNFQSPQAMQRAAQDMQDATRTAAKEARQALVLPVGLDIKSIGVDAEKSQLVELKRFLIEEFARVYSLPPVFLQDLTHGTFSNTEQQDLHLSKHTIRRWVGQFEQELNLKLFGRDKGRFFVEMNMDGLLRGDFKTRMEGYGVAIQNAMMTPNEARRKENRPDMDGGDTLMIQGATVPLGSQPVEPVQPADPNQPDGAPAGQKPA